MPTPERFERLVRAAQAEGRLPSVSAAVFRRGELVWSLAIGVADVEEGRTATPDTQYLIASITKTFVAASVFQLRDAGKLDLDDPLSRHLPEAEHGSLTIRRLLAHLSGLQRETPGEIWDSLEFPPRAEIVPRLAHAEAVLGAGERWHYSNLGYILLGEVVARSAGGELRDYVEERLLRPVGLARTSWDPQEPVARAYLVEPYSDAVRPEPMVDQSGTAGAGGLWSTTEDLVRWGSFLVDPDPAVLAPASAEAMRSVQVMASPDWTRGWGLGLELFRRAERVFVGHTGGMPGFMSILAVSPAEKTGAVVLANSTSWSGFRTFGLELAEAAIEELAEPDEWRPGAAAPPELAPLLGSWWSEGTEHVFAVRDGRLEVRTATGKGEPAVFEPDGPDRFRGVSGPEHGELLRVERDGAGVAVKLFWAGYPFFRTPEPYGQRSPANANQTTKAT